MMPVDIEDIIRILAEVQKPETCAKCGGKCCLFMPGITSPEDWGAPDRQQMYDRIKAGVQTGKYEFHDWIGDPRYDDFSRGYKPVYMVRPSKRLRNRMYSPERGHYEFEPCGLLGPKGCTLDYANRPRQCRDLEPNEQAPGECGSEEGYSNRAAAVDWLPYQDVIEKVQQDMWEHRIGSSIVRHLLEETRTLVVHQDDRSTDFLKTIYQGKGYPVLSNYVSPDRMEDMLAQFDNVFCLGHGSPYGLFAKGGGFIIDDRLGPVLADMPNSLYIWCYAEKFARRHKLSGLVSGMFISEVREAEYMGIRGVTQEEIDFSNDSFARAVRGYLDGHITAQSVKQCYNSNTCRVIQYNNERLFVMRNGGDVPAKKSQSRPKGLFHYF